MRTLFIFITSVVMAILGIQQPMPSFTDVDAANLEAKFAQNHFKIYNLTVMEASSTIIMQVTNDQDEIIYEMFYTINGSTLDGEGRYVSFEKFPESVNTIYFSQDYSNVKNKTKTWYSKGKALDLIDDSLAEDQSNHTAACAISSGVDSEGNDRTYKDCSDVDEYMIDQSIAKRFISFQKADISDDEIFAYLHWYRESGRPNIEN